MTPFHPLDQLDALRFTTPAILKQLTRSSRKLAELEPGPYLPPSSLTP